MALVISGLRTAWSQLAVLAADNRRIKAWQLLGKSYAALLYMQHTMHSGTTVLRMWEAPSPDRLPCLCMEVKQSREQMD